MIEHVSYTLSRFQPLPYKYEAGTPNIAGVLGLGAALTFIQQHRELITQLEHQLYQHLIQGLQEINGLRLWGEIDNSVALQSFTVEGLSQQDIVILLNQQNIAIRAGHHCVMPLMHKLGIEGTLRVSLACYNSIEDIDSFLHALKAAMSQLKNVAPQISSTNELLQSATNCHEELPLAGKIKQVRGWDQVYRQIMLAGRDLSRLPTELQSAETAVYGCESQVWLKCQLIGNSLSLQGDSPSKIVRGLLAIIFEVLAGKTAEQVLAFNIELYLAELGLATHLSQSRGNGLLAVVQKIQQFCELHS
jgi:cysteine desulfurase/selenocysteine lyase